MMESFSKGFGQRSVNTKEEEKGRGMSGFQSGLLDVACWMSGVQRDVASSSSPPLLCLCKQKFTHDMR